MPRLYTCGNWPTCIYLAPCGRYTDAEELRAKLRRELRVSRGDAGSEEWRDPSALAEEEAQVGAMAFGMLRTYDADSNGRISFAEYVSAVGAQRYGELGDE